MSTSAAAYDTKVTIVEMLPSIIANEDEEVVKALTRSLTRRGIEIAVGARVESIGDTGEQKRVIATTAWNGPSSLSRQVSARQSL